MSDRILAGYVPEEQFADELGVTTRTTRNYRRKPDGLPYALVGKRVLIPVAEGRDWIRKHLVFPNPSR